MPQPKDKDWLNGYKNKTPIYAVYKRPTLKQMETKRKQDQQYSDKIDFEIKAKKRAKEGHYIMIKGSIQEEDVTIINRYICWVHIYL